MRTTEIATQLFLESCHMVFKASNRQRMLLYTSAKHKLQTYTYPAPLFPYPIRNACAIYLNERENCRIQQMCMLFQGQFAEPSGDTKIKLLAQSMIFRTENSIIH